MTLCTAEVIFNQTLPPIYGKLFQHETELTVHINPLPNGLMGFYGELLVFYHS